MTRQDAIDTLASHLRCVVNEFSTSTEEDIGMIEEFVEILTFFGCTPKEIGFGLRENFFTEEEIEAGLKNNYLTEES